MDSKCPKQGFIFQTSDVCALADLMYGLKDLLTTARLVVTKDCVKFGENACDDNVHLFATFPADRFTRYECTGRFIISFDPSFIHKLLGNNGQRDVVVFRYDFKKPFELKVGSLTHFPEKMRQFERGKFDGLVLDDVRDLSFLNEHQDKLQGKYTGPVEFGSTAGGTCAFLRDLFAVPVVATVNNTTRNLHWLEAGAHDFLGNRNNVHYLGFAGRPGEVAPATAWTPS